MIETVARRRTRSATPTSPSPAKRKCSRPRRRRREGMERILGAGVEQQADARRRSNTPNRPPTGTLKRPRTPTAPRRSTRERCGRKIPAEKHARRLVAGERARRYRKRTRSAGSHTYIEFSAVGRSAAQNGAADHRRRVARRSPRPCRTTCSSCVNTKTGGGGEEIKGHRLRTAPEEGAEGRRTRGGGNRQQRSVGMRVLERPRGAGVRTAPRKGSARKRRNRPPRFGGAADRVCWDAPERKAVRRGRARATQGTSAALRVWNDYLGRLRSGHVGVERADGEDSQASAAPR